MIFDVLTELAKFEKSFPNDLVSITVKTSLNKSIVVQSTNHSLERTFSFIVADGILTATDFADELMSRYMESSITRLRQITKQSEGDEL